MIKAKDKVLKLLQENPSNRDSDNKLIANFWFYEIKTMGKDPNTLTAFGLLDLMSKSKLTNTETITRVRRQLQEQNKELRGQNYINRQTKLQNKVIMELGYEVN